MTSVMMYASSAAKLIYNQSTNDDLLLANLNKTLIKTHI